MPNSSGRPHLPSLVIRGFRGIGELRVPRLGAATLITGRNGVGKTTVLEALRLYAARASYPALRELLHRREEVLPEERESPIPVSFEWASLFQGRPPLSQTPELVIGPDNASDQLRVRLGKTNGEGLRPWLFETPQSMDGRPEMSLFVSFRGQRRELPVFLMESSRRRLIPDDFDEVNGRLVCETVGPGIRTNHDLARMWDRVALTEEEDRLIEALGVVLSDRPRRIAMIGDGGHRSAAGRRVVVKMASQPRPVPLKSLGDGAVRLFSVLVALASARGGFLLIDEAENGIHHEVQASFWSTILTAARMNSVQVVATTHSWDCVSGFARAAASTQAEDVALIRLERGEGTVRAVEYGRTELEAVASQGIEVR